MQNSQTHMFSQVWKHDPALRRSIPQTFEQAIIALPGLTMGPKC